MILHGYSYLKETPLDTDALLTVHEAAEKIGVSDSAIRNATLEGRLPFVVKFGRKLIEQDALIEYQRRTQPDGQKSKGRPRAAESVTSQVDEKSLDTGRGV